VRQISLDLNKIRKYVFEFLQFSVINNVLKYLLEPTRELREERKKNNRFLHFKLNRNKAKQTQLQAVQGMNID
jgi:Lhr-like helicase